VDYECPAWVATLVEQCDGKVNTRDHFEAGKRDQWIPFDVSEDQFAGVVGDLVSKGILEIEGFEPPRQMRAHA